MQIYAENIYRENKNNQQEGCYFIPVLCSEFRFEITESKLIKQFLHQSKSGRYYPKFLQ